jgi:hypothetical protein
VEQARGGGLRGTGPPMLPPPPPMRKPTSLFPFLAFGRFLSAFFLGHCASFPSGMDPHRVDRVSKVALPKASLSIDRSDSRTLPQLARRLSHNWSFEGSILSVPQMQRVGRTVRFAAARTAVSNLSDSDVITGAVRSNVPSNYYSDAVDKAGRRVRNGAILRC